MPVAICSAPKRASTNSPGSRRQRRHPEVCYSLDRFPTLPTSSLADILLELRPPRATMSMTERRATQEKTAAQARSWTYRRDTSLDLMICSLLRRWIHYFFFSPLCKGRYHPVDQRRVIRNRDSSSTRQRTTWTQSSHLPSISHC